MSNYTNIILCLNNNKIFNPIISETVIIIFESAE